MFLPLQLRAAENVIYISIDGMSRDTLYALLNKGSLPNIRSIIDRGNYRNMDLTVRRPDMLATYHSILSGRTGPQGYRKASPSIPRGESVFERLEETIPNLTSVLILSQPLRESTSPSLNSLLDEARDSIDIVLPYRKRSSSRIRRDVERVLKPLASPFFMFVNFTNVDRAGLAYREGSQMYSGALKRVDAAIGSMIHILKDNKLWDKTDFILTTQYGFRRNSQILSSEVWVASTQKIRFKGTTDDVVPTIYKMFGLNAARFKPELSGNALIY
jgi:predicted AlkP superfamily pyrophosphatase or phosphodiesterase